MNTKSTSILTLFFTLISAWHVQAQSFTLVNVDTNSANMGRYTSLAIINGNPAISYLNVTSGDLMYVRATDASGSAWGTPAIVDSGGNGGEATSLVVVNGNPAICYRDSSLSDVKYARATDANGASWNAPITVVSTGTVGLYSSMHVVNGIPAIAYYDSTSGNLLRFIKANDANGASWGSPVTIDGAGGLYLSMEILPDGSPGVSYGSSVSVLKFVRATDATASAWMSPVTVDSAANTGFYTSLQIVNGRPAVAYVEQNSGNLKYARSSDPNGLGWIGAATAIVTNVVNANFGGYTSLQVISNKATIAFWDGNSGAVRYVTATDSPSGNGSSWATPVTVENAGFSGGYVSLQPLPGGTPGISYQLQGSPNFRLRYAYVAPPAGPEIAVEQPAGTNIPDGGSKDFGSVLVGGNTSLTFTIKNTGSANLTGLTITKDGANTNDFTVTVSPTAPVAPGNSTTFTVQFAPGATGSRTAALHIANNDSDENPFDITLTGTGTAPEIAVEQPVGTNIADGGSKDFGSVLLGGNTSLTFTIKNTGSANLTGLTITKDGANTNDFTITASPTAPVAPGGSTTFTVQFTPGATGSRSAALHIANNDSDENPFDITLTGTGTAPEIAVEQPVGTNIADGGSKDFGSVLLGGNTSLTFTIKNTGSANLTGLTITKDGANTNDFTITASPTAPVAPGGSTTFTVQFTPGATGSRSASLHIANNDSDENPFDITLTGTGTAPEIAVEQPAATNIPDGGSKDFGSVPMGANTSLTFTIKNTGSGNLTGLTITKDGPNTNDFVVTAFPVAPVTPGGSTTFTVQFTPGATGSRSAVLHIADNDSDENPFDINVSGTGTAPEIAVEQPAGTDITDGGANDFGSVVLGGQNTLTYTIRNAGSANLTGLAITKDGANSNDFVVATSPTAPIAPGGSTTFSVQFSPAATGPRVAALHIANNDSDENPFTLNLSGTGTTFSTQSWTASSGNGNGANNSVPDSLRIRLNGGNVEFSADGGATWTASAPFASITNLTLNGSGDDDLFVLDFSGGNLIPPGGIQINGGGQGTNGDKLIITGNTVESVTHTFLNANDGSITLAGNIAGTISYIGLEPITDNLIATNRVFNFAGGAESITLADAPGASMTIDSTLSESVTFANPLSSLLIHAGSSNDTVNITSLDTDGPFAGDLTITGDNGTDSVLISSNLVLAAGKSLSVSAESVTIGPNVNLSLSGGGKLTISADSLAIDSASVNAPAVTLIPNTPGTTIDLGGADAPGTLGLSDAELDRISAGTIEIGDTNIGSITVSAAISRSTATDLLLISAAAINLNASLDSGGGNITLNPAGSLSVAASGIDVSMGSTGTLAFGPGTAFHISINGPTVDTEYQQLNLIGKLELNSVNLMLSGSYTPSPGDTFLIVKNDSNDPIASTFISLPEGGTIVFNGVNLKITYAGGDGNDVALVANSAPVLPAQSDLQIPELTDLVITNTATDADGDTLTYTLSGPASANIDTNGVIRWTPGEAQGPRTNTFVTIVSDSVGLRATNSFMVTVTEVNSAPSLSPLTNVAVNPGQTINFTATATDTDVPANTLTFSLLNAPAGASIGSGSGNFDWRPTINQSDSTNMISIRVQDDGSPSMSATNSFTAIVNPLSPVVLFPIAHTNGQFMFSVNGTAGPDYIIQASDSLLSWTDIQTNLSPATPFQFSEPVPGGSKRFYRVRLAP